MTDDSDNLERLYIEILRENQYLVSEMFVRGEVEPICYIVAYYDKIWILKQDIVKTDPTILNDLVNTFGLPEITTFEQLINDLEYRIKLLDAEAKKKPVWVNMEVLFGKMTDGNLVIIDRMMNHVKNVHNSSFIKKVVRDLKPTKVSLESTPNDTYEQFDTIGNNKKPGQIFYHGTCSEYLPSILRNGLDANNVNSNWNQEVKKLTNGKIFLTSNFKYSIRHAIKSSNTTNSIPVIISFIVRFPELLSPDWDVEFNYSGSKKQNTVSNDVGVYAYNRRILPGNFKEIYYTLDKKSLNDYDISDFKTLDPVLVKYEVLNHSVPIEDVLN